jgi:hypothetical protein
VTTVITRWSDSRPFGLVAACPTLADVVATTQAQLLRHPVAKAQLNDLAAPAPRSGGALKINNYMGSTSALGEGAVRVDHGPGSATWVQTVQVDKARGGSAFVATARGIPPRGRPV